MISTALRKNNEAKIKKYDIDIEIPASRSSENEVNV